MKKSKKQLKKIKHIDTMLESINMWLNGFKNSLDKYLSDLSNKFNTVKNNDRLISALESNDLMSEEIARAHAYLNGFNVDTEDLMGNQLDLVSRMKVLSIDLKYNNPLIKSLENQIESNESNDNNVSIPAKGQYKAEAIVYDLKTQKPMTQWQIVNELEWRREDMDALSLCLDKIGCPQKDENGNEYSMWGRVKNYIDIIAPAKENQQDTYTFICSGETMNFSENYKK